MDQLTYAQIRKLQQNILGEIPMARNDFSTAINQMTGSQIAKAGQGNAFETGVKDYSAWKDEMLDTYAGPVNETLGDAGEWVFGKFGADKAVGRQVGEESLRGLVDLLPAVAGGIIGAFAGPAGAAAGVKAGMGVSAAEMAANAFEKTDSYGQAALAGASTYLAGPAMRAGGRLAMGAVAPTIGKTAVGKALGLVGGETIETTVKGQAAKVLMAKGIGDRVAAATGGTALLTAGTMLGSASVDYAEKGEWTNPFTLTNTLANVASPLNLLGIHDLFRPQMLKTMPIVDQSRFRAAEIESDVKAETLVDPVTPLGKNRADIEMIYMEETAKLDQITDPAERAKARNRLDEARKVAHEQAESSDFDPDMLFGRKTRDLVVMDRETPITTQVPDDDGVNVIERPVTSDELLMTEFELVEEKRKTPGSLDTTPTVIDVESYILREKEAYKQIGMDEPSLVRLKRMEQLPEPKTLQEGQQLIRDANVINDNLGNPLWTNFRLQEKYKDFIQQGDSTEVAAERTLAHVKESTVKAANDLKSEQLTLPEGKKKKPQPRSEWEAETARRMEALTPDQKNSTAHSIYSNLRAEAPRRSKTIGPMMDATYLAWRAKYPSKPTTDQHAELRSNLKQLLDPEFRKEVAATKGTASPKTGRPNIPLGSKPEHQETLAWLSEITESAKKDPELAQALEVFHKYSNTEKRELGIIYTTNAFRAWVARHKAGTLKKGPHGNEGPPKDFGEALEILKANLGGVQRVLNLDDYTNWKRVKVKDGSSLNVKYKSLEAAEKQVAKLSSKYTGMKFKSFPWEKGKWDKTGEVYSIKYAPLKAGEMDIDASQEFQYVDNVVAIPDDLVSVDNRQALKAKIELVEKEIKRVEAMPDQPAPPRAGEGAAPAPAEPGLKEGQIKTKNGYAEFQHGKWYEFRNDGKVVVLKQHPLTGASSVIKPPAQGQTLSDVYRNAMETGDTETAAQVAKATYKKRKANEDAEEAESKFTTLDEMTEQDQLDNADYQRDSRGNARGPMNLNVSEDGQVNAALIGDQIFLREGLTKFEQAQLTEHELGHFLYDQPENKPHFDTMWNELSKAKQLEIDDIVHDLYDDRYYTEERAVRALDAIRARTANKPAWKRFVQYIKEQWRKFTGQEPADVEALAARMLAVARQELFTRRALWPKTVAWLEDAKNYYSDKNEADVSYSAGARQKRAKSELENIRRREAEADAKDTGSLEAKEKNTIDRVFIEQQQGWIDAYDQQSPEHKTHELDQLAGEFLSRVSEQIVVPKLDMGAQEDARLVNLREDALIRADQAMSDLLTPTEEAVIMSVLLKRNIAWLPETELEDGTVVRGSLKSELLTSQSRHILSQFNAGIATRTIEMVKEGMAPVKAYGEAVKEMYSGTGGRQTENRGWVTYERGSKEAADRLQAGTAGCSGGWCVGRDAAHGYVVGQNSQFEVYYDDLGRARVSINYREDGSVQEFRGSFGDQALRPGEAEIGVARARELGLTDYDDVLNDMARLKKFKAWQKGKGVMLDIYWDRDGNVQFDTERKNVGHGDDSLLFEPTAEDIKRLQSSDIKASVRSPEFKLPNMGVIPPDMLDTYVFERPGTTIEDLSSVVWARVSDKLFNYLMAAEGPAAMRARKDILYTTPHQMKVGVDYVLAAIKDANLDEYERGISNIRSTLSAADLPADLRIKLIEAFDRPTQQLNHLMNGEGVEEFTTKFVLDHLKEPDRFRDKKLLLDLLGWSGVPKGETVIKSVLKQLSDKQIAQALPRTDPILRALQDARDPELLNMLVKAARLSSEGLPDARLAPYLGTNRDLPASMIKEFMEPYDYHRFSASTSAMLEEGFATIGTLSSGDPVKIISALIPHSNTSWALLEKIEAHLLKQDTQSDGVYKTQLGYLRSRKEVLRERNLRPFTHEELISKILLEKGLSQELINKELPTFSRMYETLGVDIDSVEKFKLLSSESAGKATIEGPIAKIFLSGKGLDGAYTDQQKIDALHFVQGHEISHLTERLYNEGLLSDRHSNDYREFVEWTKSLSPTEQAIAHELLVELLPKHMRDTGVIRESKANMSNPEELRANLLSAWAIGHLNKIDQVVLDLMPRQLRKGLTVLSDLARSIYGAMKGAGNVVDNFQTRSGMRKNIEQMVKMATKFKEGLAESIRLETEMNQLGSFGNERIANLGTFEIPDDPRNVLTKVFDNLVMTGDNLARMVPTFGGVWAAMNNFNGGVKASMKRTIGAIIGGQDANGRPVFETREGQLDYEKVRNSPVLSRVVNDWMLKQNAIEVTKPDGSKKMGKVITKESMKVDAPELWKRFQALNSEDQKVVSNMVFRMRKGHEQFTMQEVERTVDSGNRTILRAYIAQKLPHLFKAAPGLADDVYFGIRQISTSADPAGMELGRQRLARVASQVTPDVFQAIVDISKNSHMELAKLNVYLAEHDSFSSEIRTGRHFLHWKDANGETGGLAFANLKDAREYANSDKFRKSGRTLLNIEDTRRGTPHMTGDDRIAEVLAMHDETNKRLVEGLGLSDDLTKQLSSMFDYRLQFGKELKASEIINPGSWRGLKSGREDLDMVQTQFAYFQAATKALHKKIFLNELQYQFANPEMKDAKVAAYVPQMMSMVDNFLAPDTKLGTDITTGQAGFFLGGQLSSHLLELAQPAFSMLPELMSRQMGLVQSTKLLRFAMAQVARFTHKHTPSMIMKAAKKKLGINVDYSKDDHTQWDKPEHQDLFRHAIENDWLSQSHASDTLDMDLSNNIDLAGLVGRNGKAKESKLAKYGLTPVKIYIKGSLKFYQQFTEFNTRVALITGYETAKLKGMRHEEAILYAGEFARTAAIAGGKAARPNAVFTGREGYRTLGQAAYSLQGYNFGMLSMMRRHAETAFSKRDFPGITEADRKAARKALMTMFSVQALGAGAIGMPFVGAAIAMIEKLTGHDLERGLTEALAALFQEDRDEDGGIMTDMVLHGAANLITRQLPGAPEVGSRFTLGGVMGINSYDGFSLESMMGPTTSILKGVATGAGTLLKDQDPMKAFQDVAPPSWKRIIELTRNGGEFRDKAGGLLIDATFGEKFQHSIGFTPQRVKNAKNYDRLQTKHEAYLREREVRQYDRLAEIYLRNPELAKQELAKMMREDPRVKFLSDQGDAIGAKKQYQEAIQSGLEKLAGRVEKKKFKQEPRRGGTFRGMSGSEVLTNAMGMSGGVSEVQRLQSKAEVYATMGMPSPIGQRDMVRAQLIDKFMTGNSMPRSQAALLADQHLARSPQVRQAAGYQN